MIFISDLSISESALTVTQAVELAESLNIKQMVIADSNLSGALPFYYAAKKAGIKPIFGVRHWFDSVEYLFIAKDSISYKKLLFWESKGYTEDAFLTEGILTIAINTKTANPVFKSKLSILKKEISEIDKMINEDLSTLDVIDTNIMNAKEEGDFFKIGLIKAIKETSSLKKEVASNNISATYEYKESTKLDSIMSSCKNDYKFGNPNPPTFKFRVEVGEEYGLTNATDKSLFETLCKLGLEKRLEKVDKKLHHLYYARLNKEMNVIDNMGFPGYFLIVWDFVNYAIKMEIPVGPGRGSAAGSIVAWVLGITNLDPIKYHLLFERFLNPERVSLPDIDQDFCQTRRQEVIDYVIERYGVENVAQVITFGKFGAKGSTVDVTRVLELPQYIGENISKRIPDLTNFKKAYAGAKDSWDEYLSKDFYSSLVWDHSRTIEGYTRGTGIHAAGLVIKDDEIYNHAPVYRSEKDGEGAYLIGYDGKYLEDVDLVKFDFLGLKTLSVIDAAARAVFKNHAIKLDIMNLDPIDAKVYEYIESGNTIGMFQIESPGMQDLSKKLKPEDFEDLIAQLALYRPGPMQAGMLDSFVARKNGKEKIDYFFKEMEEKLKPILAPTYGMIVYQEQVMQIVQEIGGFSLGRADLVRRAMGKKDPDEMKRLALEFADGASAIGFKKDNAIDLFGLIEKFAGYGFNKSHSAAYAAVTYITAWLKLYYPNEFMAALINSEAKDREKQTKYIREAKDMKLQMDTPNVFIATPTFEATKSGITFSASSIKGLGETAVTYFLSQFKKIDKDDDFKSVIKLLNKIQISPKLRFENYEKFINKATRTSNSLSKKIEEKDEQIHKLNVKAREKGLTDKEGERLQRYYVVLAELNSDKEKTDLDLVKDNLDKLVRLQSDFESWKESKDSFIKIQNAMFESFAKIGGLSSFGIPRKVLVENTSKILSGSCPEDIDLTGDEYSKAEIISLEQDLCGDSFSSPFTDQQLAAIKQVNIAEMNVGMLLSKVEKTKKDGGKYLIVSFLDADNNITSGSDFNNKANVINEGEIVKFKISKKGQYSNLTYIDRIDLDAFIRAQKPADVAVTVDQDISSMVIPDGADIVVKDSKGNIVARIAR